MSVLDFAFVVIIYCIGYHAGKKSRPQTAPTPKPQFEPTNRFKEYWN